MKDKGNREHEGNLNILHEYVKNMSPEDRAQYYADLDKIRRDIEDAKEDNKKDKHKEPKPESEEDWGDGEDDGDDSSNDIDGYERFDRYGRDYGDEDDGGDDANEY
jgi:hypothetical protein|tara:strand:+ start:2487 stop:2804 length:318 start_codon:yes stop_codon:yes gene_type:complete